MSSLDIALSFNERYAPGAAVVIASVVANSSPASWLRFHVFTEEVAPETLASLANLLSRLHPNGEIVQHVCGEELLKGLPFWESSRVAAVRCLYARLLPDVDWCLHLDCDLLYLSSVEAHFAERDEAVYACVTAEEDATTSAGERDWIARHVRRAGRPVEIPADRYFNSGVMLMNLRKMRADGLTEALARFFAEHPDAPSPDQDALNVAFGGVVKRLPRRYNQSQLTLTDAKLRERPVIHYVCGNPWVPGLMCVDNNRFRLWHAFADHYVTCRPGSSVRRCFDLRTRFLKHVCRALLVCPVLGCLFAGALEAVGLVRNGRTWRKSQVGSDISFSAIREAL